MRVMLMVQVGDKVTCRKSFGPSHGLNRARAHAYASKVSDRYWLVEAESAEAARRCLAERPLYGDTGGWPVGVNQHGRVLASGGRP